MNIDIRQYDATYLDEVISLFVEEYKVDFDRYKESFTKFFDHSFQKDKCIRIIAVNEDNELMGFQSFFYWPYSKAGKHYNTYQSGSSIVSRKARGQGVFQKMLSYAEQLRDIYHYDFFMGFPVEASYKSFMSNGWDNPFSLQWYARLKNPFGFLFNWMYKNIKPGLKTPSVAHNIFYLENSPEFLDWRRQYQGDNYRVFSYTEGEFFLQVSHKVNTRKKIIRELIIGEVLRNSDQQDFVQRAFHKYRRWLSSQLDIMLVSYSTNNEMHPISLNILALGLKKIDRKIYFITKYFGHSKPEDWLLFRSDIDTW